MIAISAFSITMLTKTMKSMKKDTESIQYGAVRNVSMSKAPSIISNTLIKAIVVCTHTTHWLRELSRHSSSAKALVPVPQWSWRWLGSPAESPGGARRTHMQTCKNRHNMHTDMQIQMMQ